MKIKLDSPEDWEMLHRLTEKSSNSVINLLTAAVNTIQAENIEIYIRKSLIPASYNYNPSLLAKKVQANTSAFEFATGSNFCATHIVIRLLKTRPANYARKYSRGTLSVEAKILSWFTDSESPPTLKIPIKDIPPFLLTHSEQLTYKIKRATIHNYQIKITKHKTYWAITKK